MMKRSASEQQTNFYTALSAAGPGPDIPAQADIYGWLLGSWELEVKHYGVDVSARGLRGEMHCGRILEGRAIQDVWIMPRRAERPDYFDNKSAPDPTCDMYGTTLRVWEPELQAWRVIYLNPLSGQRDELIGRRIGSELVQIGRHADGTAIRWVFSEITDDSFRWTGTALETDGRSWRPEGEFLAHRVSI